MKTIFLPLIKLGANFYSFLSGVFIALSINLYTGVFSSDQIPDRWEMLLRASLLTFISALAWIIISWRLEPLQRLAISASPKGINIDETLKLLLTGKEIILFIYFCIALFSAICGLIALLLGY